MPPNAISVLRAEGTGRDPLPLATTLENLQAITNETLHSNAPAADHSMHADGCSPPPAGSVSLIHRKWATLPLLIDAKLQSLRGGWQG